MRKSVTNFSTFRETNLVKSFCTLQFVFLSLYHTGHAWPENPLRSDYIRWDWRCSEGCVLVLPYVRIDFSANQFYFALTKHKRAVCEVKFQTNPFLTQFTVIQKTKTTLSGAGTCTLSVKNDASRIETLIPQRNSFYEENVSKLRNVIIVLFSAWIVACLCGYWLVKMFIFCGW